ncbi:MAG: D-alanine--D-alanine ligase family protein [Planctomycetota bacterium]
MEKIAILCGGPSLEHQISLLSGLQVAEQIDRERFEPTTVVIGVDGQWTIGDGEPLDAPTAVLTLKERGVETCFLALHGPFGEDGRVQGFLDTAEMRYTGSGPVAAAISGDKIFAKRVAASLGVRCARDLVVPSGADTDEWANAIEADLGLPCVVKDPRQGSTLGMAIARDRGALEDALRQLGKRCDRLLVEECVTGREFTVAVLQVAGHQPRTLPIAEIRATDGYFDYEAKYSETNGAEEICPADIDGPPAERMRAWSLAVHEAFGLRAMSRTDFILPAEGEPVYLETNSIPGLTAQSLLPKACKAERIGFSELITLLIESAVR